MPMTGIGRCTSVAPICSDIPSIFIWVAKCPVYHDKQQGGGARILSMQRLCTNRGYLGTRLPFRSQELYRVIESMTQKLHTMHYTTVLGASNRPVF